MEHGHLLFRSLWMELAQNDLSKGVGIPSIKAGRKGHCWTVTDCAVTQLA